MVNASRSLVVGILLLGVFVAGCIGAQEIEAEGPGLEATEDDGLATLRGRVLSESVDLLVGAAVAVLGASGEPRVAVTDERGGYEIDGLEPGQYRVQVTAVCCKQHLATITLAPGEVRELNVQLMFIDPVEVPYEEVFQWEAFVACMVNVGGTGPSCGAGDANDERQLRFDVQPGITNMVVAMDWTPQGMNWGDEMRFRVMHGNCSNNAGSCTYEHVRGPPPLEVTLDEKSGRESIQFPNITEEQRITVRVWADGTPNIVYQQPLTLYFHLFYWQAAPEGHSALPG